jgi:hypothetical protein
VLRWHPASLLPSYIYIFCRLQGKVGPDFLNFGVYNFHRILISSIRNLGRCPCPRCLIPLDRVANMGMRRDMAQRRTLARIDDVKRRNRVETAREKIYEKGYVVDSTAVEDLLQGDSLVPTAVCAFSFIQ